MKYIDEKEGISTLNRIVIIAYIVFVFLKSEQIVKECYNKRQEKWG